MGLQVRALLHGTPFTAVPISPQYYQHTVSFHVGSSSFWAIVGVSTCCIETCYNSCFRSLLLVARNHEMLSCKPVEAQLYRGIQRKRTCASKWEYRTRCSSCTAASLRRHYGPVELQQIEGGCREVLHLRDVQTSWGNALPNVLSGKGRGLVLTEDVKPGQLLLISDPVAVVYGKSGDAPDTTELHESLLSTQVSI